MKDNTMALKRPLFKNNNITMESFMYLPALTYNKQYSNKVFTLQPYPLITIRFKVYKVSGLPPFKVTPNNLYRVIKFFSKINNWFTDPEMPDLFMRDEDDRLVFNYNYKDLSATVRSNYTDNIIMKAMPDVLLFDDKEHEGVKIYLNQLVNMVNATSDDIDNIHGILENFNFQTEMTLFLQAFEYAVKHDRLVDISSTWDYNQNGY